MKEINYLDVAIDRIHNKVDTLLNRSFYPSPPEPLSPIPETRATRRLINEENRILNKKNKKKAKAAQKANLKAWQKKIVKTYSFEKTSNSRIRALFFSPDKWPAKEDYYNSPEWKSFRKIIIAQFPHKKGVCGCSICLKRTRSPHVHHIYGLKRAVFQLMCKQCHDDYHYIIKTTKRLKKNVLEKTALQ